METAQLNLRISKKLLNDLDVVSREMGVMRSEWVKMKLAEDVNDAKNDLFIKLGSLYANDKITKKQLANLAGDTIVNEMEFIKQAAEKSAKKGIEAGKRFRKEREIRS